MTNSFEMTTGYVFTKRLGQVFSSEAGENIGVTLVSARWADMYLPGGSLIIGHIVAGDEDDGGFSFELGDFPHREVRRSLIRSVVKNHREEERIRREEDYSPSPMYYMSKFVHLVEVDGRKEVFVIAFTADEAAEALLEAGYLPAEGSPFGAMEVKFRLRENLSRV